MAAGRGPLARGAFAVGLAHVTFRRVVASARAESGNVSGLLYMLGCVLVLSASAWAAHWERDDAGRMVAIPDHVQRIVCLAPSLTDIAYALGAQEEIVGITDYTEYPPQAQREKPSVGALVNPSLEKIVALHPDVVLALPAFNGAETIAGLQRLGVPTFLFTTTNLSDIYRNIADAGRVLGRERQATALIAGLRSREKKVSKHAAGKSRPSVLVAVAIDPLITAGRSAFVTEMITVAGARSITEDLPQDWLQVNVEAVLARKPDYILIIKGGPVALRDMQQHAGWKSLEAVQKGRIIVIDDRIQIPSPIAFDGLEALSAQIQGMRPR